MSDTQRFDTVQWQRRLEMLEAELRQLNRGSSRPRRRIGIWVVVVILVTLLVGVVAIGDPSVSLTCPGGELYCFDVNTPAKARDVNHNFAQLHDWLLQKVGTLGQEDVIVDGKLMVDESSTTYDVWIQGTQSAGGGDARNLAMLGTDEDSGDTLYLNWGAEYGGGTFIDSPATVDGDLTVNGHVVGGGGCYTRWGVHGCAAGFTEVITGRGGGVEASTAVGGSHYSGIECISNSAAQVNGSWTSTYYTRLLRGESDGNGMYAVDGDCSICCRGGCYTALGTNSCASGYTLAYDGRTGGFEAHSNSRVHGQTLCVEDTAATRQHWTSGYATRLMRFRNTAAGGTDGMEAVTNTCAVCCK